MIFPSQSFFFQIPFPNSNPISILKFHFPVLKKQANPSFYFTPSGLSYVLSVNYVNLLFHNALLFLFY